MANGKREFVRSSYLAFDHLDRLTEGENLFILGTKIAFSLHRIYIAAVRTHCSGRGRQREPVRPRWTKQPVN